jgi:apolipoprotein N-acyltransferase
MQARAASIWQGAWAWPLLAAAGLAQATSIAWPRDGRPLDWLQFLSLAVLVWALDAQDAAPRRVARRAFAVGTCFATAWLAGTFWWLFVSMHTYGGLAAPLAALAVLALAVFLALYYGAACAAHAMWPARSIGRAALQWALLWLLAELLRGHWFTGFPWGAGGYAHVDGPLGGVAKWVGVYGVGFLSAWLAAAATLAVRRWRLAGPLERRAAARAGAWALGLPLLLSGVLVASSSISFTRAAGSLSVGLLQGNIEQDQKFLPGSGVPLALGWYAQRLLATPAELVVAPETAIPLLPRALPEGYWEALAGALRRDPPSGGPARAALIGLPLGSAGEGYANAALGLAPGQADYRYDKQHLVPFGEFVPPFFRWFTDALNIPLGDFTPGPARQAPFTWRGLRLLPNICYEDLFGEEIGAHFDADAAPHVLVNLSNIGWFGDTVAIDQHLSISRMRAIEFERPMLRATNTGATAIIDHEGRVSSELPRLTRGVLQGEVQGREGRTPYAIWVSSVGLLPLWLLALSPLILAAWRRVSARAHRRPPG